MSGAYCLTRHVASACPRHSPRRGLASRLTWAYQEQLVAYAMTRCGDDISAAARLLEVTPFTILALLRKQAALRASEGRESHVR